MKKRVLDFGPFLRILEGVRRNMREEYGVSAGKCFLSLSWQKEWDGDRFIQIMTYSSNESLKLTETMTAIYF